VVVVLLLLIQEQIFRIQEQVLLVVVEVVVVRMVENLHLLHHRLMVFLFLWRFFLYALLIVYFETKP
jgi:hypothetical protein